MPSIGSFHLPGVQFPLPWSTQIIVSLVRVDNKWGLPLSKAARSEIFCRPGQRRVMCFVVQGNAESHSPVVLVGVERSHLSSWSTQSDGWISNQFSSAVQGCAEWGLSSFLSAQSENLCCPGWRGVRSFVVIVGAEWRLVSPEWTQKFQLL